MMFMHQIFAFLPRSFRDLKIPKETPPNPHWDHSWVYWLLVGPWTAMSSSALQTRTHFMRNWYQPKSWEENMAPPLSGDWEKWSREKKPAKEVAQAGPGLSNSPGNRHTIFLRDAVWESRLKIFPSLKGTRASPNYSLVKEVGTGNFQESPPPKELWDECEMRCGKLGNDRVLYSQDKI